jgi:hypothetical protein
VAYNAGLGSVKFQLKLLIGGYKMKIVFWIVVIILMYISIWQMDVEMKKQRLRLRMTVFFDTLLYLGYPLELWGEMIQQRRLTERIFGKLTRKEYAFLSKVCAARQSNGGEPLKPLFDVFLEKLKRRFKR